MTFSKRRKAVNFLTGAAAICTALSGATSAASAQDVTPATTNAQPFHRADFLINAMDLTKAFAVTATSPYGTICDVLLGLHQDNDYDNKSAQVQVVKKTCELDGEATVTWRVQYGKEDTIMVYQHERYDPRYGWQRNFDFLPTRTPPQP